MKRLKANAFVASFFTELYLLTEQCTVQELPVHIQGLIQNLGFTQNVRPEKIFSVVRNAEPYFRATNLGDSFDRLMSFSSETLTMSDVAIFVADVALEKPCRIKNVEPKPHYTHLGRCKECQSYLIAVIVPSFLHAFEGLVDFLKALHDYLHTFAETVREHPGTPAVEITDPDQVELIERAMGQLGFEGRLALHAKLFELYREEPPSTEELRDAIEEFLSRATGEGEAN